MFEVERQKSDATETESNVEDFTIGEYLRGRLMPVEGAIPHLDGIELYRKPAPAGTGGDLFECIDFQRRYDLDARIRHALQASKSCLEAHPAESGIGRACARLPAARVTVNQS